MKELLLSLAYILASILSLVLLAYLGYLAWRSWKRLDELELKDRFAARNDFIKTTAQILGGAFFLITIYFTYQNLAVSQKNLVATQEKNVTDLYTKAIGQLGNSKPEVRVGGIYALERIARQSPKDHWTIMEVLTAYVREKAPLPMTPASLVKATTSEETSLDSRKEVPTQPEKQAPQIHIEKPKPKADIQAVLTVLGRTAIPYAQEGEKRPLDLQATNLAGVDLKKANLQKADLWEANLQGAKLEEANLQGAKLWRANLQGAKLEKANLQGANLEEANLQEANLWRANLQEANLLRTDLQGAKLWMANLQGANLWIAILREASLREANLQRANLYGVKLSGAILLGADLREAKGLTAEQAAEAFWDETTKWPEGFSPTQQRKEEKKEGK